MGVYVGTSLGVPTLDIRNSVSGSMDVFPDPFDFRPGMFWRESLLLYSFPLAFQGFSSDRDSVNRSQALGLLHARKCETCEFALGYITCMHHVAIRHVSGQKPLFLGVGGVVPCLGATHPGLHQMLVMYGLVLIQAEVLHPISLISLLASSDLRYCPTLQSGLVLSSTLK